MGASMRLGCFIDWSTFPPSYSQAQGFVFRVQNRLGPLPDPDGILAGEKIVGPVDDGLTKLAGDLLWRFAGRNRFTAGVGERRVQSSLAFGGDNRSKQLGVALVALSPARLSQ